MLNFETPEIPDWMGLGEKRARQKWPIWYDVAHERHGEELNVILFFFSSFYEFERNNIFL